MPWGWNTTSQKVCHTGHMIHNRPKTILNSVHNMKDALQQERNEILGKGQDERDQQMKRSEVTVDSEDLAGLLGCS